MGTVVCVMDGYAYHMLVLAISLLICSGLKPHTYNMTPHSFSYYHYHLALDSGSPLGDATLSGSTVLTDMLLEAISPDATEITGWSARAANLLCEFNVLQVCGVGKGVCVRVCARACLCKQYMCVNECMRAYEPVIETLVTMD